MAFYYCKNLTSITIPEHEISIGWGAFDGCHIKYVEKHR
ncbi:MAG: leucine-rich repeat domain-containing protein [Paludibacteraceae bacterium]|nr:leucine-rich repeat domain-containing protein [Paludibacteraceae bacterium]